MNKQVNHIWRGFLLMMAVLFFGWVMQLLTTIKPAVDTLTLAVVNNTSSLPAVKIIQNKKGEKLFKDSTPQQRYSISGRYGISLLRICRKNNFL